MLKTVNLNLQEKDKKNKVVRDANIPSGLVDHGGSVCFFNLAIQVCILRQHLEIILIN